MNKHLIIRRNSPAATALTATTDVWKSFRQQMDDLFDRFSDGFETFSLKPISDLENFWPKSLRGFAPMAVDVAETDKSYTISAELPGVDEKNIEVSVNEGVLTIKGEKREEKEEKDKNHYMSERAYGTFQRMFALPRGTDESKIEANFNNGVLTVSVAKKMEPAARKVEVKAA